jgi:hypothetical protein
MNSYLVDLKVHVMSSQKQQQIRKLFHYLSLTLIRWRNYVTMYFC